VKRQYLFSIAIVLFVCAAASAQDRASAFGNVRFGDSPERVATAMSAAGLAPYLPAKIDMRFPLDQTFTGMLLGEKALVMALYSDSRALEKMIVTFLTDDEKALPFYKQFKNELTDRFGATAVDVERYDFPYDDGSHVGREQTAIRTGRGHLGATWEWQDAGDKPALMSLSVEKSLTIYLTYESAKWATEAGRRAALSGPASQ
jgi:hypothetical protein